MNNPRRKILFSLMGLAFVLGSGYLFIFIEERKFEAHYYRNELEKLQQQNGLTRLLRESAQQAPQGSALAILRQSYRVSGLSSAEVDAIVASLKGGETPAGQAALVKKYSLSADEVAAIAALLHTTVEGRP